MSISSKLHTTKTNKNETKIMKTLIFVNSITKKIEKMIFVNPQEIYPQNKGIHRNKKPKCCAKKQKKTKYKRFLILCV
jgi:DNA topoisomerase VI subunit A